MGLTLAVNRKIQSELTSAASIRLCVAGAGIKRFGNLVLRADDVNRERQHDLELKGIAKTAAGREDPCA